MAELRELVVCSSCHGPLAWSANEIRCQRCQRWFAVVDGIPILLVDEGASKHDELDHFRSHHKSQQASYFDRDDAAEFETTRPHGAPELYEWLLQEKFRRGLVGLPFRLTSSSTALVVCGGSGMDAEFLAHTGARVITSDISIGAARRALERARRDGLDFATVVADVERLPLRDKTVDLAYVHDGLHHLPEPVAALKEMARVSACAVSINEPAHAAVTAAAVRVGLALEREDAGNRVLRMKPRQIEVALSSQGFRIVHVERYAMYYRHQPGWVFRLLSDGMLLPLTKAVVGSINRLAGRVGNKLTVQAMRSGAHTLSCGQAQSD